jgi:hypothetical protein
MWYQNHHLQIGFPHTTMCDIWTWIFNVGFWLWSEYTHRLCIHRTPEYTVIQSPWYSTCVVEHLGHVPKVDLFSFNSGIILQACYISIPYIQFIYSKNVETFEGKLPSVQQIYFSYTPPIMILQFQKYVPVHTKTAHFPNQCCPSQQPEFNWKAVQDAAAIYTT